MPNIRTSIFTVDNIGNPEPVTADGPCQKITIREQAAAGTQNYSVYAPLMTSDPFTRVAGESHVFTAPKYNMFQDGVIVAYVATTTSSVTFSKVCE